MTNKATVPFDATTRKNLTAFSAGAALNDTGEGMYVNYLPFYAGSILGVSPQQFGFIEGLAEGVNRLLRVFTGALTDRWGRKPPMILGYAFTVLGRLGLSFVSGWAGLIPMQSLNRVGMALREPAREASVADSVALPQRGRAFGLLNTVDTFGAILGPIIGLLFILYFTAEGPFAATPQSAQPVYQWLFIWAALPALLSGWLIWWFLKETCQKTLSCPAPLLYQPPSFGDKIISAATGFITNVRGYLSNKKLRSITFSHMVLALSAVPLPMILFYAYSLKATILQGMILALTYQAVLFLSSYPAGIVVDKLGRFKGQVTANILLIIALFSLALIDTPLGLIFPIILYGLFDALWLTSRRSIISELAPANVRGQTLGMFSMFYGLAALFSPMLVGTLLQYTASAMLTFIVMGLLAIGATVLLVLAKRK